MNNLLYDKRDLKEGIMISSKTRANFKLKFALFKIWFLKNILVFIQMFLIITFVLMLTGNISASTPILGKILYPFFKPLIDEIDNVINEKEISRTHGFICSNYFNYNFD